MLSTSPPGPYDDFHCYSFPKCVALHLLINGTLWHFQDAKHICGSSLGLLCTMDTYDSIF